MAPFVGFVDLWGNVASVDTALFDDALDLPIGYRTLGIVGTQIVLTSGGPTYVRGLPNEVRAAILAAATSDEAEGSAYDVTLTRSGAGAGAVTAVGQWRAVMRNKRVHIIGTLNFTPETPGTVETITATLPTDMQPAANFAATTDANGVVAGGVPSDGTVASDFSSQVRAKVGAKTVDFTIDQTTATATAWSVAFGYNISA